MSGLPETLVRIAARSLPALQRARYREEWLADLAGAAEAGVRRSSIVLGALTTVLTTDRLDPSATGMTLSRAITLRLRTATGFGLAAALLAIGSDAYAGFPHTAALGAVVTAIVVALGVVAAVALFGAVRAALAARRIAVALLVLVGALALVGLVASRAGLMLVILAAPGVLGLFALALLITGGRVASAATRIAAAIVIPLAAFAVAAFALVHVFAWNPLAKLPGMTLSEIYAGLDAAREGPAGGPAGWIVAVSLLVGLASAAYAVFALAPVRSWRRHRTGRRLLALGLLVVGGVVALVFVPSFTMGMGIADAFGTSGGDAAGSGDVLAAVGMATLAAAILVSFVRIEPGPPQGVASPT